MKLVCALLVCVILIVINLSLVRGESPLNRDYFDDADPSVAKDKALIQQFHVSRIPDLIRQGNYSAALEDINFGLRYFPNHPTALQLLGVVARLQGKPALAIGFFEKALSLFPQHALTHAQYGAYLVEIGNIKEGIEMLQKAVAIDPKLAAAHVLLSKAYTKAGNMELARQAADQARQLGYQGKIE
jgi:Tfp pilus assembly protein PilF